jgi:hypothetical protein
MVCSNGISVHCAHKMLVVLSGWAPLEPWDLLVTIFPPILGHEIAVFVKRVCSLEITNFTTNLILLAVYLMFTCLNHCNLLQLFLSCDNCFNYQMIIMYSAGGASLVSVACMTPWCSSIHVVQVWSFKGSSFCVCRLVKLNWSGPPLCLVGVLNFNLSFCYLLGSHLFLLWSFRGKCRVNYLFIIFVCFNIWIV